MIKLPNLQLRMRFGATCKMRKKKNRQQSSLIITNKGHLNCQEDQGSKNAIKFTIYYTNPQPLTRASRK